MNVFLCIDYKFSNAFEDGWFDKLKKEYPDTLLIETNFEQVKAMALSGEIDNLVIWEGGYNWSGAGKDDENIILVDEALWEIYKIAPTLRMMGWAAEKEDVPPGVVFGVPDNAEGRIKQTLAFLFPERIS